jgi:hypothetical protein
LKTIIHKITILLGWLDPWLSVILLIIVVEAFHTNWNHFNQSYETAHRPNAAQVGNLDLNIVVLSPTLYPDIAAEVIRQRAVKTWKRFLDKKNNFSF